MTAANLTGHSPLTARLGDAQLAQCIEDRIARRASGRILDLKVLCTENLIVLRGRSRTYHAKQLAQDAALELTDGAALLSNQIEVY